jgi:hypothetical protein
MDGFQWVLLSMRHSEFKAFSLAFRVIPDHHNAHAPEVRNISRIPEVVCAKS